MRTKKTNPNKKKSVVKKKVATQKKAKGKKQIDEKLLAEAREVLPRLQAGETTMGAERDRLGFSSNRPLREALIEVLGSRDAYFALLDIRYGTARENGVPVAQISDKDVPVITSSKLNEGWGSKRLESGKHGLDVVIAPDGTEYVAAQDNERADLIFDHTAGRFKELGKSRWRKIETSSKGRAAKKEEELVVHGEKARKAKRVARKQPTANKKKSTQRKKKSA